MANYLFSSIHHNYFSTHTFATLGNNVLKP